ncbi:MULTISPECIES: hypothetical protein [Micromonospora]|uniref:Uncharacterized protein n=1 Tax=Micromonospora yangpuensis TaxID=683228 RepID=A0A1C6UV86_9ACTN|nr:hypothetical protein [Micromonospora yangpuensis]GGM23669.1 hypothetical protein GCM10012279_47410 [Micromonospora yangpuensis]SCL57901.1 hypothetical protein GA0070617_3659 [Micromonospora yangpuensis]
MLWIIETSEQISPEFQADLDHFKVNKAVADKLGDQVLNSSIKQMQTPLAAPLAASEPVFVLAHSGYDTDPRNNQRAPWIGGRWLDELVSDMIAKFTPAGLSGRVLWFLVCHTGHDVANLAGRLATAGVDNVTLYMPKDFMYISTKGIPHILPNQQNVKSANRTVAQAGCDYYRLPSSLLTGRGWAGSSISGQVVTPVSAKAVEDAVIELFDPDEDEA